ncbi:hypothetical protein C499_09389 [Halogeometricum borinquense DSM 11551]|uniref:Uncharacterized protein n=1 Tax=Halogeometricum borinquense (strain ATCC 700274 / DSM 11551 / JCM 10706 / KCTC 4070 / PR3) TaxID=469382 RepID=L9UQQ5_HALBP|nr:hypothetical protein C499_09389 [Halogeometricum borinquense DSM 11551]
MLPATFVILRAARVGDESGTNGVREPRELGRRAVRVGQESGTSGAGERYEWNTGGSGSKTNTRE